MFWLIFDYFGRYKEIKFQKKKKTFNDFSNNSFYALFTYTYIEWKKFQFNFFLIENFIRYSIGNIFLELWENLKKLKKCSFLPSPTLCILRYNCVFSSCIMCVLVCVYVSLHVFTCLSMSRVKAGNSGVEGNSRLNTTDFMKMIFFFIFFDKIEK